MTGSGGSPSEMPNLPRLRGRQSLGPAAAEGLLTGRACRPGAPASRRALAAVLEIASGPPSDREMAGEAAAVAAFLLVTSPVAGRRARTRSVARKLALAVGAVAVAGAVTFAIAHPGHMHKAPHVTYNLPAPDHHGLLPRAGRAASDRQGLHGTRPGGPPTPEGLP